MVNKGLKSLPHNGKFINYLSSGTCIGVKNSAVNFLKSDTQNGKFAHNDLDRGVGEALVYIQK